MFTAADLIHSYTRADAIADGVLVDVSTVAAEAGIKYPVAMTREAWAEMVAWDPKNLACQDEAGRLWDAVWMLRQAIRSASGSNIAYCLYRVPNTPTATKARRVVLKAICGPGDDPAPVITIMLPNQD